MNLVSKEMIINYSCLQEVAFFCVCVCVCVEKHQTQRLWFIHKEFLIGL